MNVAALCPRWRMLVRPMPYTGGHRISSRTLSMTRTARHWPLVPFLIASVFFTAPRFVDAQKAAAERSPVQKPSAQKLPAALSASIAEARTARAFDEARRQGPEALRAFLY